MAPPKVTTPKAKGNSNGETDGSVFSNADVEIIDAVFKTMSKDAKPKAKWADIAEQLGMKVSTILIPSPLPSRVCLTVECGFLRWRTQRRDERKSPAS
jgi:hypothetical protein